MAGFHFVNGAAGADTNGKVKQFHVDSGHAGVLGIGDVVVLTGTAFTDGTAEVDIGTANTANTGVITAVSPNIATEALSQTWLSASTAGYVQVNIDPQAYYLADVANGPLAVTDVGLNVPLVATAGTVSGSLFTSNMKVNATGKATTNTLPFQVVGLAYDDSGTFGGRALVRVNASTQTYGATGI